MLRARRSFFATSVAIAILAIPSACLAQTRCESLKKLSAKDLTITSAISVAAGATRELRLPAFCQVMGFVSTPGLKGEANNRVNFEIDLPVAGWNRKLYFAGGGGFSGGHSEKRPLQTGYATAYTDTGHRAADGFDATWALGSYTKKVDFFFRGIHVATIASKEVIKAFFPDLLQRSYFVGCSTGGKQALMEAQRYPDDYNGIIAGAPALDYTGLMLQFTWNQRALLRSLDSYLPAAKLSLVAKAVARQCDASDGVADGLISDPLHCNFNPSSLLCKAGDSADCLTSGQVDSLKKIYDGPVTPSGKRIFPGIPPGHEDSTDHLRWLIGTTPPKVQRDGSLAFTGDYTKEKSASSVQFAYQEEFLRYLAFLDGSPNYNWRNFDFDGDLKKMEPLAALHNATDPNLSRFKQGGGKLLMYSGWADPVVSPLRTVQYFQEMKASMGGSAVDEFAVLFMAPGMNHCGNGPGPNQFDSLGALDEWVEKGHKPKVMVATHRRQINGDGGPRDLTNRRHSSN